MRNFLLAFGLLLAGSLIASEKNATRTNAESHDLVFSYFTAAHEFGSTHPKTMEYRTELQARLDDGDVIDTTKLEAMLTELFREHHALVRTMTLTHPKTQRNLQKISIASRIMTYAPDYLAKNLDNLVTRKH